MDSMKEKENQWISVWDRAMPEDEVLCINKYNEYLCGILSFKSDDMYVCESDGEIMYDVTHWMPLPTPPRRF